MRLRYIFLIQLSAENSSFTPSCSANAATREKNRLYVNFTPGLRRAQSEPQHLPQRLILHSAERVDGRHLPFAFTSEPSVRAWRPSIFALLRE